MKSKKIVALGSLLISTMAFAKSPEITQNNVFWLSGDMGSAYMNNKVLDGHHQQLNFAVGFDVNQYIALYTGYQYVNINHIDDLNALNAGVKLSLPLSQDWSIFTKLGGYSALGSHVTHQFRGNAGIGINYQITPQFGTHVSVDYRDAISTTLSESDATSLLWGLSYRFGQPRYYDNNIGQVNVIQDKDISNVYE